MPPKPGRPKEHVVAARKIEPVSAPRTHKPSALKRALLSGMGRRPGQRNEKKELGEPLECGDVYCDCVGPDYECLECFGGFLTCVGCGSGLLCTCCYGCQKPDKWQIFISGLMLLFTSPCLYGVAASCSVGLHMMRWIED